MAIMVNISSLVQPGSEPKKPKKEGKERNLQWQTGCSRIDMSFCMAGGIPE